MAEPLTPPIEEVAGLQIPSDLAAQIIAAFREVYPTITADKDDDAAVRATLVWFITSTMEMSANRKAQAALDSTIEQLRAGADVRARQRGQQIRDAVARIKEKPVPPGLVE